ncbi:MAG: hypothetical protein IMF11_16990 [Proteobacteria bacterium]|nr:hypothetical protein [Pseudomonadota bacterium]
MKDTLKFALFAFLILVLLVGPGVGETKAQSLIEITPKELDISRIIGSQPFQCPFTVRAVNENITDLTFSPGNLMEITRGKSFIPGTNVQVNPAVTRINKGQSQDFVVTVQNIPESGQYDGTITVSYKGQPVQDTLPISVRAAKFNATPPQIILKFEKRLLSTGKPIPWTLALNEFSGLAPQEMITTLANNTSIRLDPLIHSEDKSKVISKDKILKSVVIANSSGGQGLTIKATFTNPATFTNRQVAAGKYSGTLIVQSTDLGLLTSVPVEVLVRYPSEGLAWLLIFAGILVSMMVTWWNTTGKKKNAIQGDALKLREKLSSSDITAKCREEIENMLNEVHALLDNDKLVDAQNKITDAKTTLETCVDKKKGLLKKADEVKRMMENLENDVMKRVMKLVNNPDAAVLKVYLHSLEGDLKTLKKEIDDEHYESGDDEALKEKITDLQEKLNAFTDPAPDGLLNGLENLEEDMDSFPQEYHVMLEDTFIKDIRDDLRNIRRDIDIGEVRDKIKGAHTQFEDADKLIKDLKKYGELIKKRKESEFDMRTAEKKLKKCKEFLETGNIKMAKELQEDIAKAIKEAEQETMDKVAHPYLKELEAVQNLSDPQERSSKKVEILSKVLDAGGLTEKDELCFREWRNFSRTSVETLSEVEEAQAPSPEEEETNPPLESHRLQDFLQWWTPEWKERIIKIALYSMVIIILAVLGFSQLYANKPTFGAEDVFGESLALFMWGFGIQTGTYTAASVLRTFRGQAPQ